jgi:hypothetical protein
LWGDPNAQRFGRSGQPQHGVDLFGCPVYQGIFAGVQCKGKDGNLGSVLSGKELETECKKARDFWPCLNAFTIATTAPRDQAIQRQARELAGKMPFEVSVWSWDDIQEEILYRPVLREHFYPQTAVVAPALRQVKLSAFSPRDQFHAFFSRPDMQEALAPNLSQILIPLVYELSDNAFLHGKASEFAVRFEDRRVVFEDDGKAFNPTKQMDHRKACLRGHIGSLVFHQFLKVLRSHVSVRHRRIRRRDRRINRLELSFGKALDRFGTPKAVSISVDMSLAHGRFAAERLAASVAIPFAANEIVLSFDRVWNFSGLASFVQALLQRLPPGVTLTLWLPRGGLFSRFARMFADRRLVCHQR